MASCIKLSPKRRGLEQLSPFEPSWQKFPEGVAFAGHDRGPEAWAKPQLWEWLQWLPDSLCGSLWPTSCNTAVHKHTPYLGELQGNFQESFLDTFILVSPFLSSLLLPGLRVPAYGGLSPALFLSFLSFLIIKNERNICLSLIQTH